MSHPLVVQLRFTRGEFKRALEGLNDDDARQRLLPMNCISWNIGHMAWHEQINWLTRLQGQTPLPELNTLVGTGQPATTPPLTDMWEAWHTITRLADPFIDMLTTEKLQEVVRVDKRQRVYTQGSTLQRIIYHYWYHTGENMAIRQMLKHSSLPEFVGNLDTEAPYLPH